MFVPTNRADPTLDLLLVILLVVLHDKFVISCIKLVLFFVVRAIAE